MIPIENANERLCKVEFQFSLMAVGVPTVFGCLLTLSTILALTSAENVNLNCLSSEVSGVYSDVSSEA